MKRRIRLQFGKRCFNCGATKGLHFDHHMPLCAGYPLVYGNAVVLCGPCNYAKGTRLPKKFYDAEKLQILEALLRAQAAWPGQTSAKKRSA